LGEATKAEAATADESSAGNPSEADIPSTPAVSSQTGVEVDWLALGRAEWAKKATADRHEVVVYSAYNKAFECRGPSGCCRWLDLDEEYALSFVFQGNFVAQIRKYPEGTNSASDEGAAPVRTSSGLARIMTSS
jgi:hypothetical protein